MAGVKPMPRWWKRPITREADEGFDICVCCDQTRAEGKPSCAECFCRRCFGYGVLCGTCDESPAMCVCSEPDPKGCSCRPHRHEQPAESTPKGGEGGGDRG